MFFKENENNVIKTHIKLLFIKFKIQKFRTTFVTNEKCQLVKGRLRLFLGDDIADAVCLVHTHTLHRLLVSSLSLT